MSVSVIIPSYNRFKYLLNAIESCRKQTYKPLQIIVVNDGSTQPEYKTYDFGDDVTVIHLSRNSFDIFGQKSPGGIQRNIGMQIATGEYIAFLDDDDYWLPTKLEKQMNQMKEADVLMSCTEAFVGQGAYNHDKRYKKFLTEHCFQLLKQIFLGQRLVLNAFPPIWTKSLLQVHNCVVLSSVVIQKDLLRELGGFRLLSFADDYECWLRVLQKTNILFLEEPLVYYDDSHGDGRQY